MKETQLLMNGPMVRATLAGYKTITRRTNGLEYFSDNEPDNWRCVRVAGGYAYFVYGNSPVERAEKCLYGQVGDRLWVRETWQYADWTEEGDPHIGYAADGKRILIEDYPEAWAKRLEEVWCELSAPKNYDIDNRAADRRWRPNIHMPRWACRILLEVTGVRVERLQGISEPDAMAEGVFSWWRETDECSSDHPAPSVIFRHLWESIGGASSWDANPWVWVIEFRRVK